MISITENYITTLITLFLLLNPKKKETSVFKQVELERHFGNTRIWELHMRHFKCLKLNLNIFLRTKILIC